MTPSCRSTRTASFSEEEGGCWGCPPCDPWDAGSSLGGGERDFPSARAAWVASSLALSIAGIMEGGRSGRRPVGVEEVA
eukprot:7874803-Alexandrium_andersonii.AAC.1